MIGKCVLLGTLGVLSRADIRTRELPVLYLILSGMLGTGIYIWKQPFSVWSLLGGMGVGVSLLMCSVFSRESIGKGDGYLFCVTGIFLGFRENLILLIISLMMCAVGALVLLTVKRCGRKFQMPFIPFVLAADVLLLCR